VIEQIIGERRCRAVGGAPRLVAPGIVAGPVHLPVLAAARATEGKQTCELQHFIWKFSIFYSGVKKRLLRGRAIASNFVNNGDRLFHNDEFFISSTYRCSLQVAAKIRCDCPVLRGFGFFYYWALCFPLSI